jgi:GT2 family glycosyltransferase
MDNLNKIERKGGVQVETSPEIINTIIMPTLLYPGVEQSIRTLHKNTPKNFRLILIDQGRRDLTHLQRDGLVDVIIKCGRNVGFSKAMNTGLRLVDTEFVTFANDDVELIDPTWWDKVMEHIKHDDVAGVNPHSPVNPNGGGVPTQQYKYKNVLFEPYTEEELQEMRNVFSPGSKPGAEQLYLAGCLYWTVMKTSVLADVAKKIGSPYPYLMFDEGFGAGGGEDYHMVRALGLHGYKVLGTHRVFVWHHWLSTRRFLEAYGYGESAHDTTKKGYARFRQLWGSTHGTGPNDTLDGADVYGRSGPKEPIDGEPWVTVKPL